MVQIEGSHAKALLSHLAVTMASSSSSCSEFPTPNPKSKVSPLQGMAKLEIRAGFVFGSCVGNGNS
jgi:hypothetical protein